MVKDKNKKNEVPLEQTSGSLFSKQWNVADEGLPDDVALNNISVAAIGCLAGGIFSLSVYFSPYFCFVPAVTIVLALVTLIRIKLADGMLLGKKITLIGLWLAIVFSVAMPLHHETYRLRLKNDAKKYCMHWCSTIHRGDFLRIKQLGHVPHFLKLDTTEAAYWRQYLGDEEVHTGLHRFLTEPLLLTLAALGDKAKYSYYRTDMLHVGKDSDEIVMTYAVTYPSTENKKETFFIRINASRTFDPKRKLGIWKGGDKVKGPLPLDEDHVPVNVKD